MRYRTLLAGAAAISICTFMGFRIVELERRVDSLSARLGVPHTAGPLAASKPSDSGTADHGRDSDYEQRLTQLEQRLHTLSAWIETDRGSKSAPGASSSNVAAESAILSVVERENSRIRDVQLEWHRSRWLEARQQQLALFANNAKLDARQSALLETEMQRETDDMINLLKRSELAGDPDQAVTDLQAVLKHTDEQAKRILTPQQQQEWTQARLYERKVLWPWLP
jgi:hypothetical protein